MRCCRIGLWALLVMLPAHAYGALLYNWNTDPAGTTQSVTDPDDYAGIDSREILKLWYARDAVNHYFRIDLAAAPALNSAAYEYSIQIDSLSGGGSSANSNYIPVGLSGIDQIVDSHYNSPLGLYYSHHRHNFSPPNSVDSVNLTALGGAWDHSENGGATLQWAIPLSKLASGPFLIYAATHNVGEPSTYDITSPISASSTVPEPGSAVLFAGLLGGVVWLRRRKG